MPLTLIRGDTYSAVIPCHLRGAPFWPFNTGTSNLILTVKLNPTDPDSAAVCQKALGAGLGYSGDFNVRADFVPIDFYYQTQPLLYYDIQAQDQNGNITTLVLDTINLITDITLLTGLSIPAYTTNPPFPGGSQIQVTGSNVLVSGNLTGIGGTLVYISGNTVFISGAAGGSGPGAGVSSLNGLTNVVVLAGTGGLTVSAQGQTILVSGDLSISGALTQTGVTLGAKIDALSGSAASNANLQSTGQQAFNLYTGLSGALGQTGSNLQSQVNTLTTNLTTTGTTLYNDIVGLSGQVNTSLTQTGVSLLNIIANTGQAAWLAAQNNAVNLSGNLTSTGSILYIDLTGMSGQLNTNLATITNLTQTGVIIEAQIISLSGFTTGVSGALQAQIAAGGTQVKITGSSVLAIANLTGIGGALVFTSGAFTFISGGAGGAGGGVPSVNGITSAVTIAGTGGLSVSVNGSTILVSGDPNISGALTQTGVAIEAQLNSLSGYVNNASGALQTQITGRPFLSTICMSINGGLNVISTGAKNCFQPNVAMTIYGWNIVAFQTGYILFDLQRSTLTSFPIFSGMITGGIYPSLNLSNKVYSSNVTGWNITINPGDYLQFVISGCTGIFLVNINITGTKT